MGCALSETHSWLDRPDQQPTIRAEHEMLAYFAVAWMVLQMTDVLREIWA